MSGSPDKDHGQGSGGQNNNGFGKPNFRELLIQGIEKAEEGSELFLARRFLEGVLKMPPHENLKNIYANVICDDESEWESLIAKCDDKGVPAALADLCIQFQDGKYDIATVARSLVNLAVSCQQADADGFNAEQARDMLGCGEKETEVRISMVDGITDGENPNRELSFAKLTPVRIFDFNAITDPKSREGTKLAALNYDRRIKDVITRAAEPFYPKKEMYMNGISVNIGAPIKMQNETVMPIYIKGSKGITRLVFAYYSESHASWRRFAGYLLGSYFKGDNEHFQDVDWRIQKAIDEIASENEPAELPSHLISQMDDMAPCAKDGDHFVNLILTQEKQIQDVMNLEGRQINFKKNGNKPSELIDFWFSGNENNIYGKSVTAVVRSKNKKYNYVIAVTKDGIFLKNIQDNEAGDVNIGGSTTIGVAPVKKQSWMLTPIIEYRKKIKIPKEENLTQLDIKRTFSGERGDRARVKGMHSSSKSPFFQLSNGLAEVCLALQSDDEESAKIILSDIFTGARSLTLKTSPIELKANHIPGEAGDEEETLVFTTSGKRAKEKEDVRAKRDKEAAEAAERARAEEEGLKAERKAGDEEMAKKEKGGKKADEKIEEKRDSVAPPDWKQAYHGRKFGIKPKEPKKPEYTSLINCLYAPHTVKAGERARVGFLLDGIKLTIENGATVTIGKALPGAIIEPMGPKASYKIEEKIGDHDKNPVKVINT